MKTDFFAKPTDDTVAPDPTSERFQQLHHRLRYARESPADKGFTHGEELLIASVMSSYADMTTHMCGMRMLQRLRTHLDIEGDGFLREEVAELLHFKWKVWTKFMLSELKALADLDDDARQLIDALSASVKVLGGPDAVELLEKQSDAFHSYGEWKKEVTQKWEDLTDDQKKHFLMSADLLIGTVDRST